MNITELTNELLNATSPRSAWQKGVKAYALNLLETLEDRPITCENLLNGARDWGAYSYGGNAWIYDADIAEALCTPSELERKRNGELPPNGNESWLDCQARALSQACDVILRTTRRVERLAKS